MLQKAIQKRNNKLAAVVHVDKAVNAQDKAIIEANRVYLGKVCKRNNISKLEFSPAESDLFSKTKAEVYKQTMTRINVDYSFNGYNNYSITVPVDTKINQPLFLDKTIEKSSEKLQEIVKSIHQLVKPAK